MQAANIAPLANCCSYPDIFNFHCNHLHLPSFKKTTIFGPARTLSHLSSTHSFPLTPTSSCRKGQGNRKNKKQNPYPYQNHAFLEDLYSSTDIGSQTRSTQKTKEEREAINAGNSGSGISSNMWWADFKAAFGQRFNMGGIVSSAAVVSRDRNLALPHVAVPDIRYIDWGELRRRGFKGVVFDKDNTITVPYCLTLWEPIISSIEQCKSVFGNDIAIFSNSAGLHEYDHGFFNAGALEKATSIKVIRHRVKKPSGTAEEVEKHFGCPSSSLVMVGDRYFTDIVYGNRNGFLTILTEPLSLAGEPFIVKQLRKLEVGLVNHWYRKGLKPNDHSLLPEDAWQSVKKRQPM